MTASKKSPLDGYYLTRVYDANAAPFKTVMDLPKDEAHQVTSKFTGHSCGEKDYYDERAKVENWLREGAVAGGVDIQKQHPIYFRLTEKPEDHASSPDRTFISIPAQQLDLSVCSFTFDDSFHIISPDEKHPCSKKVFNAQGVAAAIAEHGFLDTVSDKKSEPRYIEVQMWAELKLSPLAPPIKAPKQKP